MAAPIIQPIPPPGSGIIMGPAVEYHAAFVYEERIKVFHAPANADQYLTEAVEYRKQVVEAIGNVPLWAIELQVALARVEVASDSNKARLDRLEVTAHMTFNRTKGRGGDGSMAYKQIRFVDGTWPVSQVNLPSLDCYDDVENLVAGELAQYYRGYGGPVPAGITIENVTEEEQRAFIHEYIGSAEF
ncbi:hypothetical protein C8J56DRAFT_1050176 [Mycena floridula]|nr:hypothetical protein C8J56DRAFT_1050176 [Mycena floridula]